MTPRRFIYCGQYIQGGKRFVRIAILTELADTIERSALFDYKKSREYVVGCVYEGAHFSDKSASGLDNAVYVNKWHRPESVLEWEALDGAARSELALMRREADAKASSELTRVVSPLRKLYAKMSARGDHVGCAALEAAVMREMRRRLPKGDE